MPHQRRRLVLDERADGAFGKVFEDRQNEFLPRAIGACLDHRPLRLIDFTEEAAVFSAEAESWNATEPCIEGGTVATGNNIDIVALVLCQ